MKTSLFGFNEKEMLKEMHDNNIRYFQKKIEDYDDYIATRMRAMGYRLKNKASRTVLFSFGEVTITRNRWYLNGKCRIPVDEYLGLEKHQRYTEEVMYRVTALATFLPYRKVSEVWELLTGDFITKELVLKCIKYAKELLKKRDDYDYYSDDVEIDKIKADYIYIEGDGVMVKTTDSSTENYHTDLAHYVIHTGSKATGKNRRILKNKKEFIGTTWQKVYDKVLNYLHNTFEIGAETVLIANSDGGSRYTERDFKNLQNTLKIPKMEYFWDAYHINEEIHQLLKNYPDEVMAIMFEAIRSHDRQKLKLALDTVESLIISDEEFEKFQTFKKKILGRFKATKPANLRGLPSEGIGIMESQHRKITYRMKHRGMYWSEAGADTMSQLILLKETGLLRDLFFGKWIDDYNDHYSNFQSTAKLLTHHKRESRIPSADFPLSNIRDWKLAVKKN